MKAVYNTPEQEIVTFEIEDIITTSAQGGGMSNAGSAGWGDDDSDNYEDMFGKK